MFSMKTLPFRLDCSWSKISYYIIREDKICIWCVQTALLYEYLEIPRDIFPQIAGHIRWMPAQQLNVGSMLAQWRHYLHFVRKWHYSYFLARSFLFFKSYNHKYYTMWEWILILIKIYDQSQINSTCLQCLWTKWWLLDFSKIL